MHSNHKWKNCLFILRFCRFQTLSILCATVRYGATHRETQWEATGWVPLYLLHLWRKHRQRKTSRIVPTQAIVVLEAQQLLKVSCVTQFRPLHFRNLWMAAFCLRWLRVALWAGASSTAALKMSGGMNSITLGAELLAKLCWKFDGDMGVNRPPTDGHVITLTLCPTDSIDLWQLQWVLLFELKLLYVVVEICLITIQTVWRDNSIAGDVMMCKIANVLAYVVHCILNVTGYAKILSQPCMC